MTQAERQQLLYFATGSSTLPPQDHTTERSRDRISITVDIQHDSRNALPMASTCGQRISIPLYRSFSMLKAKLSLALQCLSYGLGWLLFIYHYMMVWRLVISCFNLTYYLQEHWTLKNGRINFKFEIEFQFYLDGFMSFIDNLRNRNFCTRKITAIFLFSWYWYLVLHVALEQLDFKP